MSGTLTATDWMWRDGELIRWQDAQIHVLSLAVQFGSSVFEGIRCYNTPGGPAIFRLPEHLRRLEDSCRIYRMELGYSSAQLTAACCDLIDKNGLEDCYIRPMVLRGYGAAGMLPAGSPVETIIACWPWGAYLGEEALEKGVDVCVSSWQRPEPNTYPAQAKAAGHYTNAQLMKMEAVENGYVEAIALNPGGTVSEGSGQNVFAVRDGILVTPFLDGTSLGGITRDAVLRLAADLEIPIEIRPLAREALYTADELFFTGTASELTPIRSVDRIEVGAGRRGPITEVLQREFLDTVRGVIPDRHGWLTHVRGEVAAASGA